MKRLDRNDRSEFDANSRLAAKANEGIAGARIATAGHRSGVQNTQIILALALLILLVTTIRYYPIAGASAAPSGYQGPGAVSYYAFLRDGNDLRNPMPIYSPFDFGANPGRGEILFVRLQVIQAILLGNDRYSDGLLRSTLLESAVLTMGLVLVGRIWTQDLRDRTKDWQEGLSRLLVISGFVMGTPTIILFAFGSNAAYGWLFICLSIFLWRQPPSLKHRVIAVGLATSLFALYSTAALTLAILALVYAALNWRSFGRFATTIGAFAVAYYAYLSEQVFGSILQIPRAILFLLELENSSPSNYVATNPLANQVLNLVIYGTFGIILLVAATPKLAKLSHTDRTLARASVMSLVVFAIGVSSALGLIKGIFRVSEYLTVLSLLAIPSTLKGLPPHPRRSALLTLAIVLVLSAGIHLSSAIVPAQFVSPQEVAGADWIRSHSSSDIVIFSDFRMAGPLIAAGYLKVIGVSGVGVPRDETDRLLSAIYYSNNACKATEAFDQVTTLQENRSYDVILVSTQMTILFPGIQGYQTTYLPARGDFTSVYDTIPSMGRIFDDGQAQVYAKTAPLVQIC